jgi:hypothetical protein
MTPITESQAGAAFMGGSPNLGDLAMTDPLMFCFSALRRQEV